MRKILLLAAFILCQANVAVAKGGENFVHATYVTSGQLKNADYVKKIKLGQFQFHYMMAGPAWTASDFDLSQQQINSKYVDRHSYTSVASTEVFVPDYIRAVHRNGDKILISLPGSEFIDIARDAGRREKFAAMVAAFVEKYDYDGVELDWEHTVQLDLHTLFLTDIRAELNKLADNGKQYYVTTALHWFQRYSQQQADLLSRQIDWINVMTYDMGGGIWGTAAANHNTPLAEMQSELKAWDVFSPSKICIGLANYGFYYKGLKPGERVPAGGNLGQYGRYCNYNELPALVRDKGWTESWDSTQQVAYYSSADGTEFMTLDSPRSLEAKIEWVDSQNYRGVFWWVLYSDFVFPDKGQRYGKSLLMDYVTTLVKPIEKAKKTRGK